MTFEVVYPASDDVEIRLAELAPKKEVTSSKSAPTKNNKPPTQKLATHDLDGILKRLIKLKPKKRATAVNSIKAMFNFVEPISDEAANTILENLRKRGSLSIDANDNIQFRDA